ncbi:SDR family oxidoreductase [Celerinatantimonas diazotrophica]|uniref:NAD(P)-dependent dehydrogenase (Short-subunit alcohol dehydrogenase family) n=1 Tax=Celerinatantimonas diazotrophica TaxID=412034 RepID=A0A4R1JAN5_9GAMM|nr:SDR family oxidoreductase [Celerinatantimonas diazotrophica]TCK47564.1 NAD(P)-dependent dehydrogenase (short-subunit alcohol dehydrogenase family) [Celerinatantimonas diazotrophica]CAG9296813.1 3-oxoacyl-[acyl-carrier-protein] reductase FabG [Celerinatantimonas diazotrophica]
MYNFQNKLILITGATSGMGLVAAENIIEFGGKVIVTGRNESKLSELSKKYGQNIVALKNDSASPETGTILAETVAKHGRLDGLWLNAAIARLGNFDEITDEIYAQVMDINVKGPILQVAALSKHLNNSASIIVTSSSSVYEGAAATSLYAASKGAVSAAARAWARELAPRNIRVNTLVPGPIETNFRRFLPEEAKSGFEKFVIDQVPLGRSGTAQEAANVALFLLSPHSSYITGSEIPVDGGLIMR